MGYASGPHKTDPNRQLLYVNSTPAGVVGAGATILMQFPLPAKLLQDVNTGLKITGFGTLTANVGKTVTLLAHGSTIQTRALGLLGQAGRWMLEAYLFQTGAAAQAYWSRVHESYDSAASTNIVSAAGVLALNEQRQILLQFTGQGAVNNDLIQTGMMVEFLNNT